MMETLVVKLKCLTENLLQSQLKDYNVEIEKLFSEVTGFDTFPKIQDPQLEDCAVQLWNWSVTKAVAAVISKHQKAKVRHVACSLLYSCEPDRPTEGAIRKQILVASKTGRSWLDCKNPQTADHFLRLAVKSLETLYGLLTSRGDGVANTLASKGDVEKDLLRILSCQAESAVTQGDHQEAVACMQRCKEMLLRLPKETAYISLLCYNFGVETYNRGRYEDSAFWLSQSYDAGKTNTKYAASSEAMANALRLLATVYFKWDCQKFQEKALSAVSLANKECLSISGLYLKIKILLTCDSPDGHIRAGLNEMLECKVSLDESRSTVRLLMSANREELAFEHLKRVCRQLESSPDLGAALVFHVELLLQRGKELLGKQKIEDVIRGHYAGKQLTPKALSNLHVILWDEASKHFQDQNYPEALQWFNYSLSFFKAGQMEPNLAKLQRNRASCLLQLGQLEKAKEAAGEAERCDPGSIFTHFSVYRIAVQENDVEKAIEAVSAIGRLCRTPASSEDRLMTCENAASKLLSLAAQMALQSGQQDTAVRALESLCENCQEEDRLLTALRCLVRLLLAAIDRSGDQTRDASLHALLKYLRMALQTLSRQSHINVEQRVTAAEWFRKIAWNSALQCETCIDKMRDFFVLSYQESLVLMFGSKLSQLCPPDRTLLMGQKTSLLMAAASSLHLYRTSPVSSQTEDLTKTLEYIQTCLEIWKTLKASGSFQKDPTDTLLLLYEFEARAKLNDPEVGTLLDAALQPERADVKVLETVASLAMQPPAHHPLLSKKALRVTLSLLKKQPQADLARRSKCIHGLIKLSLPGGVTEVEAPALEEVWGYYEEALSVIRAAPDHIPETETLWLLTRAWNLGILLYSLDQYGGAEKWCGLAMSFTRHLGSLRESYETQMSSLYCQILDRLDKAKKTLAMEE